MDDKEDHEKKDGNKKDESTSYGVLKRESRGVPYVWSLVNENVRLHDRSFAIKSSHEWLGKEKAVTFFLEPEGLTTTREAW